jgi:hypothetical protein
MATEDSFFPPEQGVKREDVPSYSDQIKIVDGSLKSPVMGSRLNLNSEASLQFRELSYCKNPEYFKSFSIVPDSQLAEISQ